MALASTGPTQIGNTRSCASSRRMMMGRFVSGSTIRPLTAISMSIGVLHCSVVLGILGVLRTAAKAVRSSLGDSHGNQPADPLDRAREVDRRPTPRSTGQL